MTMNKRVHELFLSRVVYYHLKILGVCPFKFSRENILVRCKFTTIYTIFLCLTCVIVLGFIFKSRMSMILSCETPIYVISDCLSVTLGFLAIMSMWINAILSLDSLRVIISGFNRSSESLRAFGIVENQRNIVEKFNYLVLSVNGTFFCLNLVRLVDMIVWSIFNNFRVLPHTCTLTFVCAVIYLKRHLCFVNEFIRTFSSNFKNLSRVEAQCKR